MKEKNKISVEVYCVIFVELGSRPFPGRAKPCATHTVATETRHQSLKGYEPKDVKLRASVKRTNNVHNFKNLQIGKLTTPARWTTK